MMNAEEGMAARRQNEEMVPLLTRHAVQVLRGAGHSQKDVAERTGLSLTTVRRVEREDDVSSTDDHAEHRRRAIGRPSVAASFRSRVEGWLKDEPNTPTLELLRRAREAGYEGHKSAFYSLVAPLRPKPSAPMVRFEGLPGEFSQHDFGQVDVRFTDGKIKRIHFFASRLKYSRFAAVTIVESERVEPLVRSLAKHFVAFGGLPLLAVFDRPKTIVTKSGVGRDVEKFNATFAQSMLDIGVGVEMSAPRSGNQKGSVERIVGWVKNSFFKVRRFVDEIDLRAQLVAWLVEVNTKTSSRATGVIPEARRQEELLRFRPIKVFPEKMALRVPVVVGATGEVLFEGVAYSMPPDASNMPATLFLYEDRLEIIAGRFKVHHRRRTKADPPAPHPEHRAAKVAAVHGKRAKLYEKRQQLLALGPAALAVLTDLVHRQPKRATWNVEDLYALLCEFGDDALRRALDHALAVGPISVLAIRRSCLASRRGPPVSSRDPVERHRADATLSLFGRDAARNRKGDAR